MPPRRAFVIGRRRLGRTVDASVVDHKRDVRAATSAAVKDGHDLIVAVGGDGTITQVASSLAGTEVPMAIIPTGTGNLLAGNLGIPSGLARAVDTAVHAHQRTIDLGYVSVGGKKRAFAVACGIGFDADGMNRTDSATKGRRGKLAYFASAILETPNIRDVSHRITLDGVRATGFPRPRRPTRRRPPRHVHRPNIGPVARSHGGLGRAPDHRARGDGRGPGLPGAGAQGADRHDAASSRRGRRIGCG